MCKSIYYMDNEESRNCLDCHATCLTCNGGSATSCLTCKANTFLNPDNSCQTTCPSSPSIYYKYVPNLTCQHLTCPDGYWRKGFYIFKELLSTRQQSCEQCHSTCQTCWGPRFTHCYSCQGDQILTRYFSCHAQCTYAPNQFFDFD